MKGTRTYQFFILSIFVLGITLVKVFSKELGFDLKHITILGKEGGDAIGSLLQLYLTFLGAYKIIKPYPMRHEKKLRAEIRAELLAEKKEVIK